MENRRSKRQRKEVSRALRGTLLRSVQLVGSEEGTGDPELGIQPRLVGTQLLALTVRKLDATAPLADNELQVQLHARAVFKIPLATVDEKHWPTVPIDMGMLLVEVDGKVAHAAMTMYDVKRRIKIALHERDMAGLANGILLTSTEPDGDADSSPAAPAKIRYRQHIPGFVSGVDPEEGEVATLGELLLLPFLVRKQEIEGFKRWSVSADGPEVHLMAEYNDGTFYVAAFIYEGAEALDDLPEWHGDKAG